MAIFIKDPAATLDYAIDWAAGLAPGQVIVASDWAVTPDDMAVTGAGFDTTRTMVTLSGGSAGCVYRAANRITLSDGRIEDRALTVRVEGR